MTRQRAIVLGCGIAGMLSASVLAERVDEVTIVERDRLPDGPNSRTGVPQSHHGHLLLPAGIRSLDAIVPGTTHRLLAHGALRLGLPNDIMVLTGQGWLPRLPEMCFALSCGRSLLEWVLRDQVLRDPRVSVLDGTDAETLCGSTERITGAWVRDRKSGQGRRLDADVVIEATGVNSRAPDRLAELGVPMAREEIIDPGLTYATRLYLAPTGVGNAFPAVFVRPTPDIRQPGLGGSMLPIERGQWLIGLSGAEGAEPPTDIIGFERFARGVGGGVFGRLLDGAEPVGGVRGYRNSANRRRHFRRLPDGFAALGDAVVATNPAYAQGVTLAANQAMGLREVLRRQGLRRGSTGRVQREVMRKSRAAWNRATFPDTLYPGSTGPTKRGAGVRHGVDNRLERLAASQPEVFAALLTSRSLAGLPMELVTPRVLWRLLRGVPGLPAQDPPFTGEELAALREPRRRSA